MYYHCRDLKYVEYGKVLPPPEYCVDDDFADAYKWLGHYCGFFPQIWLSRSTSCITGYGIRSKSVSYEKGKKKTTFHKDKGSVLFGFDNVQGFPVDYNVWCYFLCLLAGRKWNSIKEVNKILIDRLTSSSEDAKKDDYYNEDTFYSEWDNSDGLDDYLNKYLFVKRDQVVVPALNLKSAKKIVCKNEKEKKKLRRMGFIEDRIVIKNLKGKSY